MSEAILLSINALLLAMLLATLSILSQHKEMNKH